MSDQVKNLASVMRDARDKRKFVLMLGAGASLSSGVPSTATLMVELLDKYGRGIEGNDVLQRFDRLWKNTTDVQRRDFLEPYLTRAPSAGYRKLAELIRAGWFDVVVTFNFDQLLERALDEADFHDYRRLVRGETVEGEMQKLVAAERPRCKIVKLHGSLDSADYFLFDATEMRRYPPTIESLVGDLTRRDIIVCGYAFNDLCVLRAFAEEGDAIYCVNPSGVPRMLDSFLETRRSSGNEIRLDFDGFFAALHAELLAPPPAAAEAEAPVVNPFKFLESYTEADREHFHERDEDVAAFFTALEREQAPQVIVISGPGKAGKTSLVRAGIIPRIDDTKYRKLYLRCRPDIAEQLPRELAALTLVPAGLEAAEALRQLAHSSPGRRVVLFLDQIERIAPPKSLETRDGLRALGELLRTNLFAGLAEGLTLVLVGTDAGERSVGSLLLRECARNQLRIGAVDCAAFERQHVARILAGLATSAGIELDPRIIEDIATSYEQSQSAPPERRFTLAHAHAICHILAAARTVGYESYREAFDQNLNLDALHRAINVVEFMSFAEDCDYPVSAWFRNMVKVPLRESKERIADYIKAHYQELLPAGGALRP